MKTIEKLNNYRAALVYFVKQKADSPMLMEGFPEPKIEDYGLKSPEDKEMARRIKEKLIP